MDREEKIKIYLTERNIPIDSLEANSIIEGIQWADKNPKNDVYRDLNGDILTLEEIERRYNQGVEYRKKKLINKACEYLESLTYQDYAGGPIERYVPDYIINGLREAMEE